MARQAKSTKKTAATAARPARSAGTNATAGKVVGRAKASPKPAAKKPAKQTKAKAAAAKPASSKKVKSESKAPSSAKSSAKSEPKVTKGSGAKVAESVEEFIAALPDPAVTEGLLTFREQMRSLMPKGSWDKISYGVPIWHDANGLKILGYGRSGKNCSIYVMDIALVKDWAEKGQLKHPGLKHSGATLHFDPKLGLPKGFLEKLVAARLERAPARAPAAKKKAATAKPSASKGKAKGSSKAKK